MAAFNPADLFPAGPYRFQAGIRRDDPAPFFRPQDPSGAVRAERARWLAEDPARYAALEPEGRPVLAAFATLCAEWGAADAREIRALGAALEPDFLLLAPDLQGSFRLRGGAVCFPSGWALAEKMGRGLEFIHDPVPGLNQTLGTAIDRILAGLKPGAGAFRLNWGLAATDEFNLHPARALAPPGTLSRLDRLWLRVEHQVLVALPAGAGIVFGIRISVHRLDEVARDATAAEGLARGLESMPAAVAEYKRLAEVRAELVKVLRAESGERRAES